MVVPSGQPASSCSTTRPPSRVRAQPRGASAVLVSRSMRLTAEMAAKASPRKPRVPMASRSYSVEILEVAWRRKAVAASRAGMPQPLSVTRMRVMPPCSISTVTAPAPASMAFSTSSFTTEAGRSTTSPAAMRSATWGESCLISGMVSSFPWRPCAGGTRRRQAARDGGGETFDRAEAPQPARTGGAQGLFAAIIAEKTPGKNRKTKNLQPEPD